MTTNRWVSVDLQSQGHGGAFTTRSGERRVVCSPVLLGGGQLLVFACATAVRNGP